MVSWNDESELRGRLSFLSNPDSWDLKGSLFRAHRSVVSGVGRSVFEELKREYDSQRVFETCFGELLSVSRVFLDDELVDGSYYSSDLSMGEITFDESWSSNNLKGRFKLVIEYVPSVFKDLELAEAVVDVLSLAVVQLNDEAENIRLNQARDVVNILRKDISRAMPVKPRLGKSLISNTKGGFLR